MTNTTLDPLVERVVCTLAADRPDKWAEVLDGRTEARTWFVGMTAFHFGGEIDRKSVQAWIDGQVDRIRALDATGSANTMTWKHSRMPHLTQACGIPDEEPLEDVVAMATIEGTTGDFLVSMSDKAEGNHHDPDKPPRAEFRIDTSDPENLRVIDVTRTQLLPDGSLSIVTTPVDPTDQEDWVTIDVKGPAVDPYVAFSKTKLTELLNEAWSDGNSCEDGGHTSEFKREDVSKLVERSFSPAGAR